MVMLLTIIKLNNNYESKHAIAMNHIRAFDTYLTAYDHATNYVKCAHVACMVISDDGDVLAVGTNEIDSHAEMTALDRVKWRRRRRAPRPYCYSGH